MFQNWKILLGPSKQVKNGLTFHRSRFYIFTHFMMVKCNFHLLFNWKILVFVLKLYLCHVNHPKLHHKLDLKCHFALTIHFYICSVELHWSVSEHKRLQKSFSSLFLHSTVIHCHNSSFSCSLLFILRYGFVPLWFVNSGVQILQLALYHLFKISFVPT